MKIVTIIGARPQFIKAAAVSRAIDKFNVNSHHGEQIKEIIIHTGQHFDKNMSEIFFEELEISKPDYSLDIHSLSHSAMTGQMMEKIESVLLKEKPDIVLVYGDTNSTMAGALAATKLHIPIAHVEAGLRSFNRRMPEEINRVVTDHISTFLLCPTETAIDNLRNEGFNNILNFGDTTNLINPISQDKPIVFNIGDVMYDSVLFYASKAEKESNILKKHDMHKKAYGLVTIHRAENTDDPLRLKNILDALSEISKELFLIWPMHPRVKNYIRKLNFNFDNKRFKIIDPLGYLDIINLEKNAKIIFTDSGGMQKEAFFFNIPCITLRDETEWVETVESKANVLAGANRENIIDAYFKNIERNLIIKKGLFGYGNASTNIVNILKPYINYMV